MPSLFLLLNHELTDSQRKEAAERFGAYGIVSMPDELKKLWNNIAPEGELPTHALGEIAGWLQSNANPCDYVLVQGESGAMFYIVDFCFKNDLIPIYATTERKYEENKMPDESIKRKHIFRHVRFRKYERWEE